MKRTLILLSIILAPMLLKAQDEEPKYGISFSGFVKSDFFYDTRQTVSIREGHFLLWPAAEKLDANGDDMNAVPNFNFLAIQSRITGKITGPDAFGAKTSGVIEADFFGNENSTFADVNGFRLRHAFVKLNWTNTELLAGQFWHPMFVTDCFPGVISFNTGAPFQPFSRNPQLRVTQKFGDMKVIFAALSHRDFATAAGSEGLRNSAIPDLNLHFQYGTKNADAGTEFLVGLGVEYKTIVPRLTSSMVATPESYEINFADSSVTHIKEVTTSYKVDESVSSYAAMAYSKIKLAPVTINIEGVYGQNMYDAVMISSIARIGVADSSTMSYDYTPTTCYSVWTDILTNGKTIQGGLFVGYTGNLGSSGFESTPDKKNFDSYGTRYSIESVLRIAPRIIFNSGKTRFAGEIEYTSAAFGDGTYDNKAIPQNTKTVSNIRFLLSAYYFF
ncbi:MAG: hypothetical protein JXB49_30535 [Bacteroidales bacterium]|nr:hypothetical protein [Bacteroidales bacterium]